MKKAALALASVAFVGSAPINAAPNPGTVQFLYETCKTEMAASSPRFCLGYILGVGQLMAVNAEFGDNFALCSVPRGVAPSGGAMIQAFLQWAEKHPESFGQRNLLGLALALRESWPCPAREVANDRPDVDP
jgi:hypothetical protein